MSHATCWISSNFDQIFPWGLQERVELQVTITEWSYMYNITACRIDVGPEEYQTDGDADRITYRSFN